jgi:hypothetical protein
VDWKGQGHTDETGHKNELQDIGDRHERHPSFAPTVNSAFDHSTSKIGRVHHPDRADCQRLSAIAHRSAVG